MTITLTNDQLAGLNFAASNRNTENPKAQPMTDEEFAADLLGIQCGQFFIDKISADKAAMAENDRLMSLGSAVQARPDKFDEIEKAVQKILSE